jgi:hypothetical protein
MIKTNAADERRFTSCIRFLICVSKVESGVGEAVHQVVKATTQV